MTSVDTSAAAATTAAVQGWRVRRCNPHSVVCHACMPGRCCHIAVPGAGEHHLWRARNRAAPHAACHNPCWWVQGRHAWSLRRTAARHRQGTATTAAPRMVEAA